MSTTLTFRAMRNSDLATADRVFRIAFGTWFQLPDPLQFRGDAALFGPRLRANPDGGVVAEADGAMVGLGFASRWGSLGVLGPIAVLPQMWRQGLARQLIDPVLEIFVRWDCRPVGLFTFPQSATHLRLYQDFGFWPRHLTPVMAKPVGSGAPVPGALSLATAPERPSLIAACRELTDGVFPGLDLGGEIATVLDGKIGDVIALADGARLDGFAICHSGAGSESGTTGCYVKFALVRSGDGAAQRLSRLVAACEAFAAKRGVAQLSAGVSTGRHHAYRLMAELGFRTQLMGVQMLRPWQEGFDRPEIYALDDWR
jgi:GNAT superfamily N-acetyltransferase